MKKMDGIKHRYVPNTSSLACQHPSPVQLQSFRGQPAAQTSGENIYLLLLMLLAVQGSCSRAQPWAQGTRGCCNYVSLLF